MKIKQYKKSPLGERKNRNKCIYQYEQYLIYIFIYVYLIIYHLSRATFAFYLDVAAASSFWQLCQRRQRIIC